MATRAISAIAELLFLIVLICNLSFSF